MNKPSIEKQSDDTFHKNMAARRVSLINKTEKTLTEFSGLGEEEKKSALLECYAGRNPMWVKMEEILVSEIGDDEYDDWADENGIG